MAAITCDGASSAVQVERCIGCGLCVTTCPTSAMTLHTKPDGRVPPPDTGRLYARMFRERFGVGGLVSAVGRRVLGLKS